ncbi:MAG: hypothetical protein IJ049_04385 [Oscillospiraceae bacterium]|nr:hypothetical protein [Oscillospiraceae bacterium]
MFGRFTTSSVSRNCELNGICGVEDPLPAGESANLNLDLAFLFGELPAGHYRLSMENEAGRRSLI